MTLLPIKTNLSQLTIKNSMTLINKRRLKGFTFSFSRSIRKKRYSKLRGITPLRLWVKLSESGGPNEENLNKNYTTLSESYSVNKKWLALLVSEVGRKPLSTDRQQYRIPMKSCKNSARFWSMTLILITNPFIFHLGQEDNVWMPLLVKKS